MNLQPVVKWSGSKRSQAPEIAKYIRDNVKNNDLVLTLGAGTVTEVGPKIVIE